jgi:glycerol kinase
MHTQATRWYLVLDQGSHASRALAFDDAGKPLGAHTVEIATHRPRADFVEHDAEALIDSLRQAIDGLLAGGGPDPGLCAAAGLAIQRSSIACWDRESGEALSPVISWQDRRNADWLRVQNLDSASLRRITGLVASPHYGASKLRWCLDELPEVRRALAEARLACGPLASFVLFRLLRERPLLADPANAARTLLWDVQSRDWSRELLAQFDIPRECLPTCVPSRHDFGLLPVRGQLVPLTVVTGDQPAALFAWGEPDLRALFVNLGTGAFVQRAFAGEPPDVPGLLRGIAWQDAERSVGVLEGTVNGAGAAYSWLAAEHGISMTDLAEQVPGWLEKIDRPPLFINGVAGLGSPWWRPDCPVRFSRGADLPAQAVAVAESIVFLLMANIEAIAAAAAGDCPPTREIIATGGVARLDGLCQRLADLSGLAVIRPAAVEATARGLAVLLGSAPGEHDGCRFAPAADPGLAARYPAWRQAMADALV